ncbi:MAG: DNA mismatch endonuclease Vsr, partial [Phycisphaerales bacterium]|nr:DNA mismatch endonuclease Vsr [Phycisphaerales bacterium]
MARGGPATRQRRERLTRSQIMARVRDRDTAPERRLRSALHARGLRFRTCKTELPGKPDIVLAGPRICVFVDGDYWHGGQWARRGLTCLEEQFENTQDRAYWIRKIERNMARDCRSTADLLDAGWTVLRFWESDLSANLDACAELVVNCAESSATIASDTTARMRARLARRDTAEFFCGIGLMRYALQRQGWRVAFANDIDPKKREMYAAHFDDADAHYHLGDIHALNADNVPSVTLATAAFPCNDLSLAGARRGLEGAHSSAFWGFARLLREMGDHRPPLVMIENVAGLLNSHNGRDLRTILEALNQLDYDIDAVLINARRFTPQSRPRLFVVGMQGSLFDSDSAGLGFVRSLAELPFASWPDADARPEALREFIGDNADLRWRLRRLPPLPDARPRLAKIVERLAPDDALWWEPDRAAYLLSQMSPAHQA